MPRVKAGSVWDEPGVLDSLESEREQRRKLTPHQTFDCFNGHARGDRVVCVKGYRLGPSKDGSLYLRTVLKGTTSSKCRTCPDFNGD